MIAEARGAGGRNRVVSQVTEEQLEAWASCPFDEDEVLGLIGTHLLVGITHMTHSDEVLEQEQFHGTIVRVNRRDGLVVQLHGSEEERSLPPDLSRLEPASAGTYTLRSTGEEVVDPDYTSSWLLYPPPPVN